MPPRVIWEGDFFITHSLARINRELCRGILASPGNPVDLRIRHLGCADARRDPTLIQRWPDLCLAHDGPHVGSDSDYAPDLTVRLHWPPNEEPPPTGKWILFQPWELGGMPVAWEPILRQVDACWAISNFNRRVFNENLRALGLDTPTEMVPCGVDLDTFTPDGETMPLSKTIPDGAFVFLYVGGLIWRKGIDILIDAYIKAFRDTKHHERVALVIKGMGSETYYSRNNLSDPVQRAIDDPANPSITMTEMLIADATLAGLYRRADALVAPYRGEGFCLPALEAIACGTPIITTAGGPTDDLHASSDRPIGERIPSELRDLPPSAGIGETIVRNWHLAPDVDALVHTLRTCRDGGPDYKRERTGAARAAASQWSWATPIDTCRTAIAVATSATGEGLTV